MRYVFAVMMLIACAPSETLPTACAPACGAGQVCVNATCLAPVDAGTDTPAPDVPTVDASMPDVMLQPDVPAVDATPDASAPDVSPDTPPTCTNTLTDPMNCGRCGNRCNGVARCMGGVCECGSSGMVMQTMCGGVCVDLTSDANCGGCGSDCRRAGLVCTRSSPIWHCAPR